MKINHNPAVLKWIGRVSGSAKLWVLLRTVIRIGQSLIAILYAHALGRVVDMAASGDRALFMGEMRLFALYTIVSIVLLLLNRYFLERSKNAIEKRFRIHFFSQLLYRDYSTVSKVHNGEWMTRITSDTDVITQALTQIIPESVNALVRVLGVVFVLQRMIPQVTLVLVAGGLLMGLGSFLFQTRLKRYHKNVQKVEGSVRSFMQERLYSLLVIHAFSQEKATQTAASQKYDTLNAARMKRHRFSLFCNAALSGAMVTAQLLGVGVCGFGILNGTIGYGSVSTVLYLINMLEAPLNSVSGHVSQFFGMIASAERLMEIEQNNLDLASTPVQPGQIQHYYSRQFHTFGLENADFSYEEGEDKAVLRNFNLKIQKGDYVAFTGESGCGKSTTLKILLALYPLSNGSAYLQSTDGTRHTLDASWRGLFAYVPQGNQLISGTIRETLTFCDPSLMAQDAKLMEALEIACADSFVKELPNGLDTVLGEQGSSLSEGQVQRLSVARALLSKHPILLLDESTSALDSSTEEQLLKNLRAMTDRTVLIITHREAALKICNKQIHFEKASQ